MDLILLFTNIFGVYWTSTHKYSNSGPCRRWELNSKVSYDCNKKCSRACKILEGYKTCLEIALVFVWNQVCGSSCHPSWLKMFRISLSSFSLLICLSYVNQRPYWSLFELLRIYVMLTYWSMILYVQRDFFFNYTEVQLKAKKRNIPQLVLLFWLVQHWLHP